MASANRGTVGRDFTLEVPKFVTMSLVHRLIDKAQPILQAVEPFRRFTVDASQLTLITPVGLATLASILLVAVRRARFERGFVVDPKKTHVRTYLSRMNFNRLLRVPEKIRERPHRAPRQARFRELVEVATEEDCVRVTEQMCTVLKKRGQVGDVVLTNLMYCLPELLENVVQHAESPTNGVACAQAYRESGAVELAIADCGIGIRASLVKNPVYAHRVQSDEEAAGLALQKGVTSNPGRNTGEGLFFVAELMARAGRMRLHSGSALLTASRTARTIRSAARWPGTIVGLRFETKKGVPIREIFDKFAPPEEGPTLFPLDEPLEESLAEEWNQVQGESRPA